MIAQSVCLYWKSRSLPFFYSIFHFNFECDSSWNEAAVVTQAGSGLLPTKKTKFHVFVHGCSEFRTQTITAISGTFCRGKERQFREEWLQWTLLSTHPQVWRGWRPSVPFISPAILPAMLYYGNTESCLALWHSWIFLPFNALPEIILPLNALLQVQKMVGGHSWLFSLFCQPETASRNKIDLLIRCFPSAGDLPAGQIRSSPTLLHNHIAS